jgi:hypothetical protein
LSTARAGVCRGFPTERRYLLSLGSRQGNSHVLWHLARFPPGVPFEQQQLAALDTDPGLDLGEDELDELAARIRDAMAETGKERPGA